MKRQIIDLDFPVDNPQKFRMIDENDDLVEEGRKAFEHLKKHLENFDVSL